MIRRTQAEDSEGMLTTTDGCATTADSDEFYEPHLRFGIRRPPQWRFLPPSWSPARQLSRVTSKADWARHARMPFVAMTRDLCCERQPNPTIQVTCRRVGAVSPAEVRRLLDVQLEFLTSELDEFERLETSFDLIIGGRRAAHVRYRYTLTARAQESTYALRVLARSYLVLAPGFAFTIAMSSSADERYYDAQDFTAALASVRIGVPGARVSAQSAGRPRVVGWRPLRRSDS